jgi:protein SCO1/2
MQRRALLRAGGAGIIVGVSGCLSARETVLDRQRYETDPQNLPYPTWGEAVPEVTLPDPISGDEVTTDAVGVPAAYTFFFSHCMSVCPVLIGTLRNVQAGFSGSGREEMVRFLPITFDPTRDDGRRLEEYADQMNIDLTAGNWSFLRPESVERAERVVTDRFGVVFDRTEETEEGYMFAHTALTLLVNAEGIVERAYRTGSPDETQITADMEALVG